MWNLPPPPGFRGFDPENRVTIYRRRLPHWRQDGATYFVTFRLHDSLPASKLRELAALRSEWARQVPPIGLRESTRRIVARIEQWLDEGLGSCRLKDPLAAAEVVKSLHHFDGVRYELGCYVVMANHAHVILRPLDSSDRPLETILASWKSYTSRRINRQSDRSGSLWQEESFDRIIRDEEHLYRVIQYIGRNPAKAGLAAGACPLWIRPEWQGLGWKFESP